MKRINPIFVNKIKRVEGIFFRNCTSQGIPVVGSNHPYVKALILKIKTYEFRFGFHGNYSLVIDCGPDF
jgi:hypothetical protein